MKCRIRELVDAEQFKKLPAQIEKYDMKYLLPFNLGREEPSQYYSRNENWSVTVGDWIATDKNGKHWVIRDDVFRQIYEPAEADR